MEKRQFRIGELAQQLELERFVIRFWEKEFKIAPHRSPGGQRFYTEDDLKLFTHIKSLLYDHGFTISGAKQHLTSKKSPETYIASQKDKILEPFSSDSYKHELIDLKNRLVKLHNLL
ncbi:MAG TPA: MerR family transcriptional regulator [Candidatus Babeliales bacterium]|nr:MerR family transcriptional regulator [Candidatus Babeliales bacterium]